MKRGRPPLPVAEKREHQVHVWLRKHEHAALRRLSTEEAKSVSTKARELIVAWLRREGDSPR